MHHHALLCVRILALAGCAFNAATLLANLAQSYDTFNPSYAGFYLEQQLVRPAIGFAISLALAVLARPLARLLASGIDP